MRRKKLLILLLVWAVLLPAAELFAQELTLLYTGETHAMLYPCSCPIEVDGGVARRATLIKQLRKANPQLLLLDSGPSFAGGLMDEYTLNTGLDTRRSEVNIEALTLMKYDALAVGDEEFNFGTQFLRTQIKKSGLDFLSCNIIEPDGSLAFKPYIIKEVKGLKVGIIGLSPLAAKQKAEGLNLLEAKPAVKMAVEALKKEGADIIILLSHEGESEDLKLLKEVKGIDVVIIAQNRLKEEPFSLNEGAIMLKPSWQGRRLGKLTLKVKDKKITDYKVEELRVSDKYTDDADILKVLPRCFSDSGCKEKGMQGSCLEPGSMKAACTYTKAAKVALTVITAKDCIACNAKKVVERLSSLFPGLTDSYIYYPSAQAEKMVGELNITSLPAFLLGKEAENEKGFDQLKENLEPKGGLYLIKPAYSGLGFLPVRKKIKGKLDIFISLYDKNTAKLLDAVRPFNPDIHLLAAAQKEADAGKPFAAKHGSMEVEECLRAVCVKKYYPDKFYDYITCRSRNSDTSWWEDCLKDDEASKVRSCSRSNEAPALLSENISLNAELQVMFGPAYLVDNQEIFSTEGIPSKEDFKKLFRRN